MCVCVCCSPPTAFYIDFYRKKLVDGNHERFPGDEVHSRPFIVCARIVFSISRPIIITNTNSYSEQHHPGAPHV